jgi:hypothetical protein
VGCSERLTEETKQFHSLPPKALNAGSVIYWLQGIRKLSNLSNQGGEKGRLTEVVVKAMPEKKAEKFRKRLLTSEIEP